MVAETAPAGDHNYVDAIRRERESVLAYCSDLSDKEWRTPSAAAGWTVQDVVAHLGANARAVFGPDGLAVLRTDSIERVADAAVEKRRDWSSQKVLEEYARWSSRLAGLARVIAQTPASRLPIPLGELGRYPVGMLLTGAMVFDQHTHLRHDIAPVLDRPIPTSDEARLHVAVTWMFAVLSNQIQRSGSDLPGVPVSFELTGIGGGTWGLAADGSLSDGALDSPAITISGRVEDFPSWGTRRSSWRDANLTLGGDTAVAETFLDSINVV
ncbi:maleylpyruvate isomerase family mycothiol-dependent enzyme [Jongsikchunia kroppenstedtii]|uniref:maleylpyruvate isomerase family mycothiol-dependent enzyme n=1 Tax=Jongsikchunia kroppenstedtii TaxID=1121721 RepID=UPI00035E389F|nr:maleylpyruvate isomerase family mycothiol-dependent enzyme [Jongsikchunia kroppenstedtii]